MLTIDRREKKLLDVYDAPHAAETLDVGDFICRYEHKTWKFDQLVKEMHGCGA